MMRFSIFYLLSSILLLTTGCTPVGAVAAKLMPAETVRPKYVGLAGQSVGVAVWTDRGIQIDYPSLGLDLANSIDRKLRSQGGKNGRDELKLSTFPVQPASIARFQQDHPTYDMKNVTELAPRLGVSRLIYVEVEDFGTRAPASVELFRGSMTTGLKVVEVSGPQAKVAYEEPAVKAIYPPKVPEDGTPDGDDIRFYNGTIDAMSTQIVQLLVSHEAEE